MGKMDKSQPRDAKLLETPDLDLVNYLTLRKFEPIDRTIEEDKQAFLIYKRTPELDKALADYMNRCTSCGIIFKEVGPARAKARSMLLDGLSQGEGKKEAR